MTQLHREAPVENVRRDAIGAKMLLIAKSITQKCELCIGNNPKIQIKSPSVEVKKGVTLDEYWQINFSELHRCNQYCYVYVLLLGDVFSVWLKDNLCRTKLGK